MSAEESIVVRFHVVPHRGRLEVSRSRLQVFLALVIVQRNSQAGNFPALTSRRSEQSISAVASNPLSGLPGPK